jgi:DNA-binding response OmpR family regulator
MIKRSMQHVVLLAEDNHSVAHAWIAALHLNGFNVIWATDGASALALARGNPPDLLLTDWRMPRLDGVTLSHSFRHSSSLASVPIILSSSLACPSGQALWDLYLRKPVQMTVLLNAISTLIGNSISAMGIGKAASA